MHHSNRYLNCLFKSCYRWEWECSTHWCWIPTNCCCSIVEPFNDSSLLAASSSTTISSSTSWYCSLQLYLPDCFDTEGGSYLVRANLFIHLDSAFEYWMDLIHNLGAFIKVVQNHSWKCFIAHHYFCPGLVNSFAYILDEKLTDVASSSRNFLQLNLFILTMKIA